MKDRFSLPEGLHYLNAAYMTPLSKRAEAAGREALERARDPTSIEPADFFAIPDRVRRAFGRIVNGDPERVAIVPAASYGIATAARNTPVEAGQNVVVLHEQFPSHVYAWRRVAGEAGAELRTVAPPAEPDSRGEGWNARLLEAIDRDTAAVAVPHVHWTDGTLFDLEAVGERAREAGAALVIDGTQSVGALPFDVGRIRPDALVCAGYKWLTGPYGIGVAWFGPRYDGGVPLEENWINRRGSEEFAGLVDYEEAYQPGAVRYDAGEKSSFVLGPILAAALEELLEWGIASIRSHCREVLAESLAAAREMGYRVEVPEWRAAHLVGVRIPDRVALDRLREALDERDVVVSLRGDAIRVSPHLYNDTNDAAALEEALRSAAG
ncbi:MAG: aminotransferase class V-fold PLP-dependent enzyme [Gemmatimonadota bacterium]|nr:aminotransferase class V-fold PLP-dependent enzyme [Gemmatimonadota bacterium]